MSDSEYEQETFIVRYGVVDTDDVMQVECNTEPEAREAMRKQSGPCAIVRLFYSIKFTEYIWTPDGGTEWPPEGKQL